MQKLDILKEAEGADQADMSFLTCPCGRDTSPQTICEAMGEQQDAGAESRSKINNNIVIYETLTSSQAPSQHLFRAEVSMGKVYKPTKMSPNS